MKKDLIQLHSAFMRECEFVGKLSPETLRGYRAGFDLLMKLMPAIDVETVSSETMTEFFLRLDQRERRTGGGPPRIGIKKSTAATYRSKLNKFFDWLQQRKIISENPFTLMPYPAIRYEDRKFLKRENIEKIFAAIAMNSYTAFLKKRELAMFSLLLSCGLRRSELLNLRVYDIDLERKTLLVRAETSKSRRDRTIPLNSMVLLHLAEYFSERKKRNCASPYLFVSSNQDTRLTCDGLKHIVANLNLSARVDFHLHQFRHTFAVNMLNSGCDIAKLKQLMGHSDIRMTAVYLRCLPTNAMRADVEKITFSNLL